jgi:hypothetical protein
MQKRQRLRIRTGVCGSGARRIHSSVQTSGSPGQAILRTLQHVERVRHLQRTVLPAAETPPTGAEEGEHVSLPLTRGPPGSGIAVATQIRAGIGSI